MHLRNLLNQQLGTGFVSGKIHLSFHQIADKELCEALGPELITAFTMLKRAEWERYVAAVSDPTTTEVTDWELRYYLPFY